MIRKWPFATDTIHHVYNRGVAKSLICSNDSDRWRFMQGLCLFNDMETTQNILWRLERDRGRLTMNVLKNYIIQQGNKRKPLVHILAYCVMGNHFHLLLKEIQKGGISKFMQKLGIGYAEYFNNKYERVGSLFQNRFKNILVDNDTYLQNLLVYINVLNPAEFIEPNWKEQGIHDINTVLKCAEKYPWSSHLDYLGKRGSLILEKGLAMQLLPTSHAYLDLVTSVLEGKKYTEIEHLTLE
jgi:REP element-mobilizing transposase RayT